jgi:hypothetical protein
MMPNPAGEPVADSDGSARRCRAVFCSNVGKLYALIARIRDSDPQGSGRQSSSPQSSNAWGK